MLFGRSRTPSAEVAATVLAYLQRHPDAADTLEGIVRWWLPQQRYETEKARIEQVLETLVGVGTLRRERLPDGALLYGLSKSGRRGGAANRP
ncbi:MAG TPA: hypothetical protein VFI49_14490 [Rudaea sp.]|nr:hypothetical protein [Rudaea sp.]